MSDGRKEEGGGKWRKGGRKGKKKGWRAAKEAVIREGREGGREEEEGFGFKRTFNFSPLPLFSAPPPHTMSKWVVNC